MRIIAVLCVVMSFLSAQEKFEYFPDQLNIQPFTANMLEPKLGALFHTSTNELRLDIGNSIDLIKYNSDAGVFSFGADFFTYTLLRKEKDFHFPVDAVDYLFGINVGYKTKCKFGEYGFRFRLSHISAHFVDGHAIDNGEVIRWRDGQASRVYSREFIEVLPFIKIDDLRIYGGFTYLFHVDPVYIKKDNFQFGFDYINQSLHQNIHLFAGYDFKMIHLKEYTSNHSISLGVKFGKAEGKGLSLYYNYFAGNSIHGEYFDKLVKQSSLGFNIDL